MAMVPRGQNDPPSARLQRCPGRKGPSVSRLYDRDWFAAIDHIASDGTNADLLACYAREGDSLDPIPFHFGDPLGRDRRRGNDFRTATCSLRRSRNSGQKKCDTCNNRKVRHGQSFPNPVAEGKITTGPTNHQPLLLQGRTADASRVGPSQRAVGCVISRIAVLSTGATSQILSHPEITCLFTPCRVQSRSLLSSDPGPGRRCPGGLLCSRPPVEFAVNFRQTGRFPHGRRAFTH